MLYVIYDAAKHGIPGLVNLRQLFTEGSMLLDKQYDADLEFVAPWLFSVDENSMHILKSTNIQLQDLLWFESKVEVADIITAFQKLIYNNYPENAKQFFRVWDIQVLMQELSKPKGNPVFDLFKVIDNIYLLKDEMMKMYYLDFWGVLNNKTIQNILNPAVQQS